MSVIICLLRYSKLLVLTALSTSHVNSSKSCKSWQRHQYEHWKPPSTADNSQSEVMPVYTHTWYSPQYAHVNMYQSNQLSLYNCTRVPISLEVRSWFEGMFLDVYLIKCSAK